MTNHGLKPVPVPIAMGQVVEYAAWPGDPARRYRATVVKVHGVFDRWGWPRLDLRFEMVGADGLAETLWLRMVEHWPQHCPELIEPPTPGGYRLIEERS